MIRSVDENCNPYTDEAPTTFSTYAFFGTLGVWIVIFFCIFRGVSSSSYIVWVTVPLPCLFVLIMIINGA